jgi:hypothetical protein
VNSRNTLVPTTSISADGVEDWSLALMCRVFPAYENGPVSRPLEASSGLLFESRQNRMLVPSRPRMQHAEVRAQKPYIHSPLARIQEPAPGLREPIGRRKFNL